MENSTQAPTTRTFMCAVVFLDIVEYSKKPVARQLVIKSRFNEIVARGLENVASADRIILDTGDGAALCFLGDPEDALFVTNSIRNDFAAETNVPELKVRLGINLGPVKVMRDLNGNPNIVGDGINVAQRVMSFAQTNQILVSRSYFEVVSRLTQEYSQLFRFIGAREDKHVREHELYEVAVGGSGGTSDGPADVIVAADHPPPPVQPASPAQPTLSPAPTSTPVPSPEPRRMSTGLIVGVTAAICLSIGLGAVLIAGKRDTNAVATVADKKRELIAKDGNEAAPVPRKKAREQQAAERQTTPPPVSSSASAPAPAAPQSGVFVNGRQLTLQEAQQHQAIYNTPVQPGRYWYDPVSGLYGFWGREPIGYIRTGHGYGGVPTNASNGNTGIFLNGRQINHVEAGRWQNLFRQAIQPGRYWLDGNSGNVGVEGNPTPTGNVRSAIQASRGYR
jgi:hypothetical protein